MVVDEESAVLGLSGLRETQLKLDADHSQMCKVGSRGPMYRLIKGNIKQLVDQALLSEQGFIPQPTGHSTGPTPPPLPPRLHSNSSAPYSPPGKALPPAQRIVGSLYTPLDNDPRSIRSAELKNKGKWNESRTIDYEIFQEHLRTLGADHISTLTVGYNLAEIELEASHLDKATEWCQWVSENTQRVFGTRHSLTMKIESLAAEVLYQKGQFQEVESICANVLACQQMNIGEDHFDTLDTRRRLGMAYNNLNRRENAIMTAEKLTETLKRLLGENHIRVFASALDMLEYVIYNHASESTALVTMHLQADVQRALEMIPLLCQELQSGLGHAHPLTIRALSLHGRALIRAQKHMEASEKLRQALTICEEALGPEHPLTMDIVGNIGMMYALQGPQYLTGSSVPGEAFPWLLRYLNWCERYKGADNPETQIMLETLGNLHYRAQEYEPAQKYFERAVASFRRTSNTVAVQRIGNQLQICRTYNTMLNRAGAGNGFGSFLSSLQRF